MSLWSKLFGGVAVETTPGPETTPEPTSPRRDLDGELYAAVERGNKDAVERLIKEGARIDLWGQYGTPLHRAVYHERADIVDLLLEHGADPAVATATGNSPLHMAVMNGFGDVAESLLKHGANVDARGQGGLTAFELGRRNRQEALVERLQAKYAAAKSSDVKRKAYLIALYKTAPLSDVERDALVSGSEQQLGCPTVLLQSIRVPGPFPTGPDAFVVATALLACKEAGIEFKDDRDTISFRGGEWRPDESIGLITIVTVS